MLQEACFIGDKGVVDVQGRKGRLLLIVEHFSIKQGVVACHEIPV